MSKAIELRQKRAELWEKAKLFLDNAKRNGDVMSAEDTATYEKMETAEGSGIYYPSIKEDFIPLLINKTKADIDKYNTVVEMKNEGALSQDMYDSFTGASVSTNNILRILQALFEYHANTWWTE